MRFNSAFEGLKRQYVKNKLSCFIRDMITDFPRSDARNFGNVTLFKHPLVRFSEIL
jgi:hypothetical protein